MTSQLNPAYSPLTVERQPMGSASTIRLSTLENHDAPKISENHRQAVTQSLEQFAGLARMLRTGGALVVTASMSIFLLQGWSAGNDLHRYYLLLSQTLLLAAGGLALSYLLKENKGARVFFGLSLLSATADMTMLGALVFSLIPLGGLSSAYPAFARWHANGPGATLFAAGCGSLALAGIAGFSFLVLARRSAKGLAATFFLCNLLLLVPVRESWMVGVILLVSLLLPAWNSRLLLAFDPTLRTKEGYFALATLFAPAVIIAMRTLCFYPVDAVLELMLAAGGFLLLRNLHECKPSRLISKLSLLFATVTAYCLANVTGAEGGLFYLWFGIAFSALAVDVISRRRSNRNDLVDLTAAILAGSQLVAFVQYNDAASVLAFILAGTGLSLAGKSFANRRLIIMGLAMVVSGIGQQLYQTITFAHLSNWMTLAFLGTGAIVIASLLERHGAVIKLKWQQTMQVKVE